MLNEQALSELEGLLGPGLLCTDPEEIRRKTGNTLGLERPVMGIIQPETEEQVQAIVLAANRHRLALYPYSTARNIGYGERLPVTEGNLLVDLGRMNEIVHLDPDLGYADVQPGVSQGQLSEHVRAQGMPFFVDATGSSRDSSIVGNSAEGGFGSTPRGNKRKEITCVRGVYGNGERFDTGFFPGSVGPDLAGMFVQSGFGIITQLRVPLNPVTEDYRSFMITVPKEADFLGLIEALRGLRQRGTLTNQVVITNALDALGASRVEIPDAYKGRPISNAAASEIMSSRLGSFGAFAAIGAVYGSRAEVRARRKTLRRALGERLGKRANLRFMTTRSLDFLTTLLSTWPFSKLEATAKLAAPLRSFREAHGMMQGVPSDDALIGLLGEVKDTYEDARLMWYSSRVSTRSADVSKFVAIASSCYERHGFEYPLEMLMVTPNDLIAIQKVDWDRDDPEQEKRAWKLYESLGRELRQAGFPPYRLGVQSQENVLYPEERRRTLEALKRTFDPNGVIAPGRYGISLSMKSPG
jgi:4-cresol dehydrogenase (hydroxylating)